MVNAALPPGTPLWFRNSTQARPCRVKAPKSERQAHQSKIYAKHNRSNFPQFTPIAKTWTSRATANAEYRLREKSQRDVSNWTGEHDVLSYAHGILARAGARAAANRENA
jgi:hypothetical protein